MFGFHCVRRPLLLLDDWQKPSLFLVCLDTRGNTHSQYGHVSHPATLRPGISGLIGTKSSFRDGGI